MEYLVDVLLGTMLGGTKGAAKGVWPMATIHFSGGVLIISSFHIST